MIDRFPAANVHQASDLVTFEDLNGHLDAGERERGPDRLDGTAPALRATTPDVTISV
jgi:hypothetical protein